MKKTNIRIFVQGQNESAADFAVRLEGEIEAIQSEHKLVHPPAPLFTTASDGRQTANIAWYSTHTGQYIELTPVEVQSGSTRVDWAQDLIEQLPADHEGRNSWLMNYATHPLKEEKPTFTKEKTQDGEDQSKNTDETKEQHKDS